MEKINFVNVSFYVIFSFIGGLLPDIDSEISKSKRYILTIFGIASSLMFLNYALTSNNLNYQAIVEIILWYIFVRYVLGFILSRYVVHRGIFHSIPIMLCWSFGIANITAIMKIHLLNQWMTAIAISSGFFSHLILDEICSVNLENMRIKRSFGSALKFATEDNVSTSISYIIMIILYLEMPSIDEIIINNKNIQLIKSNEVHLIKNIHEKMEMFFSMKKDNL